MKYAASGHWQLWTMFFPVVYILIQLTVKRVDFIIFDVMKNHSQLEFSTCWHLSLNKANHWRLISIFNSHSCPKIINKNFHGFRLFLCSVFICIIVFVSCGCCFSVHFLIINRIYYLRLRLMVLPFKSLKFWFANVCVPIFAWNSIC